MNRPARLMLAAACTTLLARDARAATMQLGMSSQFEVQVKGKVDPGSHVYKSRTPPWQFVVTTPAFPRPVLVTTGPLGARLIDSSRVSGEGSETLSVDTGGSIDDILGVRPDGSALVIDRNGVTITLAAAPPILGDRTLDELAQAMPEYRRNAAAYSPDRSALDKLRHADQPTELVVFFGSWCSHCEEFVPRLVRVLQEAQPPALHVTFHGVPPGGGRDDAADDAHVTGLPTGILRRDGKELSRLVDRDWDAPETSLAAAVAAKTPR